jgi:hypothetical protein
MWIARDPKEDRPPVEARKFSQVFVITRRLLLQFRRDDRAMRQSEDGAAALFVMFLPRFVIRDVQEIVIFHGTMIHKILGRDRTHQGAAIWSLRRSLGEGG